MSEQVPLGTLIQRLDELAAAIEASTAICTRLEGSGARVEERGAKQLGHLEECLAAAHRELREVLSRIHRQAVRNRLLAMLQASG